MSFSGAYLFGVSLLSASAVALAVALFRRSRTLPLPPGPPTHPILGNAGDIPQSHQWPAFARLSKIYGPVMHLRVLTQHIIVLNSLNAVMDLLDKRGSIYSDRPRFVMMSELMGWGYVGALRPYGDTWRAHRRIYHRHLHEGATAKYLDLQVRSKMAFLHALQRTPHRFMRHIQHLTTSSIMALTYGIDVGGEDDPWVQLAQDALDNLTAATLHAAVEWLPALKYVPEWFPGAGFKRFARASRALADRFRFAPLEWTREQIRVGDNRASVAASLIQEELEGRPLPDSLLADATATLYVAGADTTVALLAAFFMYMVLHPDKQAAAQEELDRVVGHGRLPDYADRDSLPYVTGVLLEVIRLHPALPLGLAHRVTEEDQYRGMRIPRGSVILPNVWSILRDEELYASPNEFLPERYLRDGELDLGAMPDPRALLFGFGRRMCPGRHFADAAAWMAVATVLACFSISPAKDDDGRDVLPTGELRAGLVSCPKPFSCEIVPRSKETKRRLLSVDCKLSVLGNLQFWR